MLNTQLVPATTNRVLRSLALRTQIDGFDAFAAATTQADNGDEARYADKSGTYTKGLLQSGIGLVDLGAYQTFKHALSTGAPADFEAMLLGGSRTQNGPQGGLAFYLSCPDSSQFAVPPAPALASEEYATELVEMYWASLLRDVAFTDYLTDPVAAQAAAELSGLTTYAGPRDPITEQVTRTCCSAAGSLAKRTDPTCRSSCCSPRPWARCRSSSSTRPTPRAPTSCWILMSS